MRDVRASSSVFTVRVHAVEVVGARAHRHHDLLERGVARPLAEPVDRALHLPRTGGDAGQRVRHRQAEVVVAVRRHLELAVDVLDDVTDQRRVLLGHAVADGVGDVQRGGAVAHRELAHLDEEVDVGAAAVLGRELDVVAVALGAGDGTRRLLLHLLLGHPELLLHVDRRRRDEDVDARLGRVLHRFPRAVDVLERGARQRGDGRAADGLADGLHRLEVALAGDREAGLDHVDAEASELLRDLELLADVERDARRLLTVPQGGVEDLHVVAHGCALSGVSQVMVVSDPFGAELSGKQKPPRP